MILICPPAETPPRDMDDGLMLSWDAEFLVCGGCEQR